MYKRVLDFLKKHEIIYDYQFGFRPGHSTNQALYNKDDRKHNRRNRTREQRCRSVPGPHQGLRYSRSHGITAQIRPLRNMRITPQVVQWLLNKSNSIHNSKRGEIQTSNDPRDQSLDHYCSYYITMTYQVLYTKASNSDYLQMTAMYS